MGGDGSTRWDYHCRKRTVEEAAQLTIAAIRAAIPRKYGGDGRYEYQRDQGFAAYFPSLAPATKPRVPRARRDSRWPVGLSAILPQYDSPRLERSVFCQLMYGNASLDVELRASPMRFGGLRWWIVCPGCQRQRTSLYLPRGARAWRCRTCYGLSYYAQRLEPKARTELRMQRISRRLHSVWWENWLDFPPAKPKWMRQRAYARHVAAWERASEAREYAYNLGLLRFLARFDPAIAKQLRSMTD